MGFLYSSVYPNVKKEILARSYAGKLNRTTKAIDYMVGKIANVEATAYDDDGYDGKIKHVLGGKTVRTNTYDIDGNEFEGKFLPTGKVGYLESPSKRPGPFIEDLKISFVNPAGKFGIMNHAVMKIIIPDVKEDLDNIEDVWFRLGRKVKLKIAHPPSAVLTEENSLGLTDESLDETAKTLKEVYPGLKSTDFTKLNELGFRGVVTSFRYDYQLDASIIAVIDLQGSTGIYGEVSLGSKVAADPATTSNGDMNIKTIDVFIIEEVNKKIDETGEKNIQIIPDEGFPDRSIIYGTPYLTNDKEVEKKMHMVSLGWLINEINHIVKKKLNIKSTVSQIICDTKTCKSNLYKNLVSSNSKEILLFRGDGSYKTDQYESLDADNQAYVPAEIRKFFPNVISKTKGFYSTAEGSSEIVGHPSMIYISTQVIKDIIKTDLKDKPVTVKSFLSKISDRIFNATGGAIQMRLIPHNMIENAFLYYDANYLGNPQNLDGVPELKLPIGSTATQGAILRDFKISCQLTQEYRTLIYGPSAVQAGDAKVDGIAANLFVDPDDPVAVEKMKADFKENHKTALEVLKINKSLFAKNPISQDNIDRLTEALKEYIKFPKETPEQTNKIYRPLWPLDLEFTIDGINGIKFGDLFTFDGIPRRYRDKFTFCANEVTHGVTNTGDWTTNIKCFPRIRTRVNKPEIAQQTG